MKEMSLDEIRSIQLNLLKELASFCEENNITYFLAGGTLLGAIRHKGYIPWDDDIDILMPRPDYGRFLKLFNENNSNNKIIRVFANEIDGSFPYTFAKLVNCNTYLKEDTLLNYSLGVNIDIFPIDGLPSSLREINMWYKIIDFLRKVYFLKILKPRKGRNIIKEMLLYGGRVVLYLIPTSILARIIILCAKRYSYEESEYVGCLVWGYGKREIVKKEVFRDAIEVEFEGFTFKAPIGYKEYLTSLYGDYMKLPPKEQRVSHHKYKAYWKY